MLPLKKVLNKGIKPINARKPKFNGWYAIPIKVPDIIA
tara:strand:+ start:1818 stop:1931 length:114 start_codon:yes stop_codon:yes gene_type:complete